MAYAYGNLALMAVTRNQLDQAVSWAQKGVQVAPSSPEMQDTLGWVYQARGDMVSAKAALQKAVRAQPRNPEFLYHMGVVFAKSGQKKEAADVLKQALALSQNFPSAGEARKLLASL